MGHSKSSPDQRLVEYAVDRVVDETNTDTKILVLARRDGQSDSFPIWIGAAEGHAIKLALDTTFRDEHEGTPCVDFNRTSWPHGDFGNAKPHSELFVVADADLR